MSGSWRKWTVPLALGGVIAGGVLFHRARQGHAPLPAAFSRATQNPVSYMPSEADFEAYASQLKIDAQGAPYHLAENVFIVTREDMARIAETVRARVGAASLDDLLRPLLQDYDGVRRAIEAGGAASVLGHSKLEAWNEALVEGYVLAHQAGFIEYAYRQAGYGTEASTTLDVLKTFMDLSAVPALSDEQKQKLAALGMSADEAELMNIFVNSLSGLIGKPAEGITIDMIIENFDSADAIEFKDQIDAMTRAMAEAFRDMDQQMLNKIIGETLLGIETRSYMMSISASGGFFELLTPNTLMNRTHHDGSVLVGNDGTQSDGDLILDAIPIDPRKTHPDFRRLCYLPAFINYHEAGHHVMGAREELAEQYGALQYLREYPQNAAVLRMMLDFRNLHSLVGNEHNSLLLYGRTDESLKHVLGLEGSDYIAALDSIAEIQAAAREGHGPDKIERSIIQMDPRAFGNTEVLGGGMESFLNMEEVNGRFRQLGQIAPELALRVAVFEEYQRLEREAGITEPSTVVNAYLNANKDILAIAEYWNTEGATFDGMIAHAGLDSAAWHLEYIADLDPAILDSAASNLKARYSPDSMEHQILSAAITALRHFADPVNAYGLSPNFEAASDWEEPVIEIGISFMGEIEYDGFADIRSELERLERRYSPGKYNSPEFELEGVYDLPFNLPPGSELPLNLDF